MTRMLQPLRNVRLAAASLGMLGLVMVGSVTGQTPPPPDAATSYYVSIDGVVAGPFPPDEIKAQMAAGKVKPDAYVLKSGETAWARATDVPAFQAAAPVPVKYRVSIGGVVNGPFPAADILQRMAAGEIKPDAFVLQEGASAWVKATEVADFKLASVDPEPVPPVVPEPGNNDAPPPPKTDPAKPQVEVPKPKVDAPKTDSPVDEVGPKDIAGYVVGKWISAPARDPDSGLMISVHITFGKDGKFTALVFEQNKNDDSPDVDSLSGAWSALWTTYEDKKFEIALDGKDPRTLLAEYVDQKSFHFQIKSNDREGGLKVTMRRQ